MALEPYLLRSPGTFTQRGTSVFAQVRPRTPESCGHPLAKARSEGFRVTRPAEGTFQNLADPSSAGWLSRSVFNAHVLFNAHVFIFRVCSVILNARRL